MLWQDVPFGVSSCKLFCLVWVRVVREISKACHRLAKLGRYSRTVEQKRDDVLAEDQFTAILFTSFADPAATCHKSAPTA
jgi:hypothetical protein